MTRRRVVITGLGVVSPVGNTVSEAWDAISNGRSGIGEITRFDTSSFPVKIAGEVKGFDLGAYLSPKEARRMDGFIQSGPKSLNQLMGQISDKSHRIGQEHFGARLGIQGPDRGIERGEELVGHEHLAPCHRPHERGFPGIGVPHERNRQFVFPSGAARQMLIPDRRQLRPEFFRTIADSTLIELQTRLSGSLATDSPALPLAAPAGFP